MKKLTVIYQTDTDTVELLHNGYRWSWDTPEGTGQELVPAEGAAEHFAQSGREDIAECIRTGYSYRYGHREYVEGIAPSTCESLQDLTGKESGIIVHGSNGVIVNWTAYTGIPRLAPLGYIDGPCPIPRVPGTWCDDLASYLEGIEIHPEGRNEDEYPLITGTIYDLGSVTVIAPDDWI